MTTYDDDWWDKAACLGVPNEVFFPTNLMGSNGTRDIVEVEMAYSICDRCPVQAECLDFAVKRPQEQGIWGRTSHRERRRMRAAMRISESS